MDGDKESVFISLSTIFKHIDGGVRCLQEGECVLQAQHVTDCWINSSNNERQEIFAFVLKTSKLQGAPHEVRMLLNRDSTFSIICSCVAGSCGKCKHCIALLLHVNQVKELPKYQLSCTDKRQAWGNIKKRAQQLYRSVPVESYCCVRKSKIPAIPEQSCLKNLLNDAAYETALHKHIFPPTSPKRKKAKIDKECQYVLQSIVEKTILTIPIVAANSVILPDLTDAHLKKNSCIVTFSHVDELEPQIKQFYTDHVCVNIETAARIATATLSQNTNEWMEERKKRLTASRCYEIYTYKGNLAEKAKNMLSKFCQFTGNSSTKQGLKNEKKALKRYEVVFETEIECHGLIISPKYPYLAVSPDGIVHNKELILIEVKCPVKGQTEDILYLVENNMIPYVYKNDLGEFSLRKCHRYYGQIQFALYLLGINVCNLVLFSVKTNGLCVITVKKDLHFAGKLFPKLQNFYFSYYLPELYKYCNA